MSFQEILTEVQNHEPEFITITGGEPLAQPGSLRLMELLCDQGCQVSLETSGALDISGVDPRVSIVLDLKTPDSGESHRNLYGNIDKLKPLDQVKFVICSRSDYEWARFKLDEYGLAGRVDDVLFSPSHGQIKPVELADWIIEDNLPVRFQMQLHKLLWKDEPGH